MEYRSAHFSVATDLSASMAASLVEDLEQMRAYLVVALFGAPREIPGRIRVVAFRDPDQVVALTGQKSVAGVYTRDRLGEPLVVVRGDGLQTSRSTVAHELAHHFSWYAFPRQPLWFSEGLAMFVQTIASEGLELKGAMGLAPREYLDWAKRVSPVPAAELLAWKGRLADDEPGRHHVYGWLLVHYLVNSRPKEFLAFQRRLGAGEDPAAAWRAAFPEWDPARPESLSALDDAIQGHRRAGTWRALKLRAEADAHFERAPLAPAEIHAQRLLIRHAFRRGGADGAARAEAEE
ncbi:MAG TPA: hypothetical protein VFI16_11915, partial [Anaeromyxobacteraceae bacterium]|nr:hypothetical protein [Anaeromyxobacteraceae bacterium]